MSKSIQNIPFRDKHPFLVNSVLIICAFCASVFIALLFIDVFTSHGQEKVVPEVRNLPLEKAIEKLEAAGLKWEIADSSNYNESFKPGVITDQEPRTGSSIKAIRPVYLYVNAMHPREFVLPNLVQKSLTIARTTLHDMGFKYIEVDTVQSQYETVVSVTANGRQVAPGKGVPINARIRITVGDGSLSLDGMPTEDITDAERDSLENLMKESGELEI